jgi:uncharacterized protein YjbI with pentapeptide repeats
MMANREHLRLLEQGASAWNQWRGNHPEETPDLVDAQLSGRDLRGHDFSRARLARALLDGADVAGASFEAAWLKETILNKANMEGARLQGAVAAGARFIDCDLRSCLLNGCFMGDAVLWHANLRKMDLRTTNFSGADLGEACLAEANLSGVSLARADLRDADCESAIMVGTNLQSAQLVGTRLDHANLADADLTGAHIVNANLRSANLSRSSLQATALIGTDLSDADLSGSRVFGISAWALRLSGTRQKDLIITTADEPGITCDDVEIAQFIYLLLNNEKLRNVIDTVGKKAVLILGRFTPERKEVLEALREALRMRDYLPILFDFEKPGGRDLTETVSALAHLARFVIADITDAKSIPQELQRIVPNLPSLPIQPVILASQYEYAMFKDFGGYLSVLTPYRYESVAHLLTSLDNKVIAPAVDRAKEIEQRRRAFEDALLKP